MARPPACGVTTKAAFEPGLARPIETQQLGYGLDRRLDRQHVEPGGGDASTFQMRQQRVEIEEGQEGSVEIRGVVQGEPWLLRDGLLHCQWETDQRRALVEISRSRTEPANRVERAGIILVYLARPAAEVCRRRRCCVVRCSSQTPRHRLLAHPHRCAPRHRPKVLRHRLLCGDSTGSTVESIIADVAKRGDAAVGELSDRFDKWSPASFRSFRLKTARSTF